MEPVPFLQGVLDAEASEVEVLTLFERVEVGTRSFEALNVPENGGLPPLETEGVVLDER